MDADALIQDLFFNEKYNNLNSLLDLVNTIRQSSLQPTENITSDFVDEHYLSEIRMLSVRGDVKLFFGRTLRDLKCILRDNDDREHWFVLLYKDLSMIRIVTTSLPHSAFQDREYSNVHDVVDTFKAHVDSLVGYFMELEKIDRFCCVVDPLKPSFKDDFRKIVLADRVWLHIEVTPEGSATNVHLVGHSDSHNEQLQEGLRSWDHDKDIVDNVMDIFDLVNFPQQASLPPVPPSAADLAPPASAKEILCGICLCQQSANNTVPQPLCPHERCPGYFHTDCLFAWLVASAGGRVPPLGVASGSCPGCFEPISCAERDT